MVDEQTGSTETSTDGLCEKCGKNPGVPVVLERVTSYLVLTDTQEIKGVWCPDCARTQALRELVWSAAFGWWGIPLGPLTFKAIGKNLKAMSTIGQAPPAVTATFGLFSFLLPAVIVFALYAGYDYLTTANPDDLVVGDGDVLPPEFVASVERGNRAWREGRLSEAVDHFDAAESVYDSEPSLFWTKAQVYEALGWTAEAKQAAERAWYLRQQQEGVLADTWFIYLYEYAHRLGNFDAAEKGWRLLVGKTDKHLCYSLLASLLRDLGRHDEAIEILDQGLALEFVPEGDQGGGPLRIDDSAPLVSLKTSILIELGRLEEARQTLALAMPEEPTSFERLPRRYRPFLLQWVAYRLAQGDLAGARSDLDALARSVDAELDSLTASRGPGQPPGAAERGFRTLRAFVAFQRSILAAATAERRAFLEKGLEVTEGGDRGCRFGLAEVLFLEGESDQALEILDALTPGERFLASEENLRFEILLETGRIEQAAAVAARFQRAQPGRGSVQAMRALVAARQGDPAHTEEVLASARRHLQGNLRAMRYYLETEGRILLAGGDVEAAAERFGDAIDLLPDAPISLRLSAARAWLDAGTADAADWSFLETDPDSATSQARQVLAQGHLWRGVARSLAGDRAGAAEDWRPLAEADPSAFLPDGYFAVWSARLLTGRADDAAYQEATAAIEFDLRDDRDLVRGLAFQQSGRVEDARALFRAILERDGLADMPCGLARQLRGE